MFSSLLKKLHAPVYAERLKVLADLIVPQLEDGDLVLDVGCGVGTLASAILNHAHCPKGVVIRGLEKAKRGGEPIEVIEHKEGPLPLGDASVDVVIFADVLHHEVDDLALLEEAKRITKRSIIVKDHTPAGFLGYFRICLIDWAANNPHGIPCLFRYYTVEQWGEIWTDLNLNLKEEKSSVRLYPPYWNFFFGNRLQYFSVAVK